MDTSLFSQVNTVLSVRETELLAPTLFQSLLDAKDREQMAQLLQGSPYVFNSQELSQLTIIEERLMKELIKTYTWAFEHSPYPEVVQLFSLKYTYHNLKVLLKAKARQSDLKHLLIPIGYYSLEALEHAVLTLTDEQCPAEMLDEIRSTWHEYQDYRDVRVIEIGMDFAYFKHLKRLLLTLDDEVFEQLVSLKIDFYNLTTVKRGLDQDKPRSFIYQLVSDEGRLTASQYIEVLEEKKLLSWFNQINPEVFDLDLASYEHSMSEGILSSQDLERLESLLIFKVLDKGRYDVDGPIPLARYLFGKELEVKNLRLILIGRDNQLTAEQIAERMRPIYGQ
ncbi:V-type ATPase subunit [Streptococcus fryi]